MRRPRPSGPKPALDVPPELLNLNASTDMADLRRRQKARRAFTQAHGLPATWWHYHDWTREAQRRFLEAGGTPPPRQEVTRG